MSRAARNALIGILGLILLVAPMVVRSSFFGERGTYTPPEIEENFTAATPIPTVTPVAQQLPVSLSQNELRAGPVVVDLAHFNFLDITKFQPLSSALAQRGIGTEFWLPVGVDAMEVTNFLDFPDQSEKLAVQLEDASALVIVSPFFLWSPEERDLARDFVADGGRLLLISDPDIMGDLAQGMNLLAEPYGVVFNDDYLYNTERNDENFTYTFQGDFLDRAADLEGSEIVFYGARSIVGSVTEQVRSSDQTLSSSRTGLTSFTTVAIAGLTATDTEERVLAMSDFDVLSEPFVDRYDNTEMLHFVADFLAGGGRDETLVDFPGSLGKEISLVYGTQDTVDAQLLGMSAKLQQRLARSGRDMRLAQSAPLSDGQIISSTQLLTGPLASLVISQMADVMDALVGGDDADPEAEAESDTEAKSEADGTRNGTAVLFTPAPTVAVVAQEPLLIPDGDIIYLADFETAGEQEMLLADAGFTLIQVARTPTPTPSPSPTASPTSTPMPTPTPVEVAAVSVDSSDSLTETSTLTGTASITGTGAITGTGIITDGSSIADAGAITGTLPLTTPVDGPAAQVAPIAPAEDAAAAALITETGSLTGTSAISGSMEISPTATVEPEPIITGYLVSDSGLQLLASETVLIFQQERSDGEMLVAVLGNTSAAINAGVERLLERNFADCFVEDEQAICPFVDTSTGRNGGSGSGSGSSSNGSSGSGSSESGSGLDGDPTPAPIEPIPGETLEPEIDPEDDATPVPDGEPVTPQEAKIIIVDDNANASDSETSEAQFYMTTLTAMGANPAIWSVADSGTPPTDLLVTSDWLIWSSGGYAEGGPAVSDLDPLFEVLNAGGRITISSQNTFFGQTQDPPSRLSDIVITSDEPALTLGLSPDPIGLPEGAPLVAPVQANTAENPSLSVILRRGPASEDADEPVLFILVDEEDPEATGARLMVLGMSISWLPPAASEQLISNMMSWMLE